MHLVERIHDADHTGTVVNTVTNALNSCSSGGLQESRPASFGWKDGLIKRFDIAKDRFWGHLDSSSTSMPEIVALLITGSNVRSNFHDE